MDACKEQHWKGQYVRKWFVIFAIALAALGLALVSLWKRGDGGSIVKRTEHDVILPLPTELVEVQSLALGSAAGDPGSRSMTRRVIPLSVPAKMLDDVKAQTTSWQNFTSSRSDYIAFGSKGPYLAVNGVNLTASLPSSGISEEFKIEPSLDSIEIIADNWKLSGSITVVGGNPRVTHFRYTICVRKVGDQADFSRGTIEWSGPHP